MDTRRNLLVAVGSVALSRGAIALIYNLAVYPLFRPALGLLSTSFPLWLAWCLVASSAVAVVAGLLCGAAIQSERPARWRALLIVLTLGVSPPDPAPWLFRGVGWSLLAILVVPALLASASFSVGRTRALRPRDHVSAR